MLASRNYGMTFEDWYNYYRLILFNVYDDNYFLNTCHIQQGQWTAAHIYIQVDEYEYNWMAPRDLRSGLSAGGYAAVTGGFLSNVPRFDKDELQGMTYILYNSGGTVVNVAPPHVMGELAIINSYTEYPMQEGQEANITTNPPALTLEQLSAMGRGVSYERHL